MLKDLHVLERDWELANNSSLLLFSTHLNFNMNCLSLYSVINMLLYFFICWKRKNDALIHQRMVNVFLIGIAVRLKFGYLENAIPENPDWGKNGSMGCFLNNI